MLGHLGGLDADGRPVVADGRPDPANPGLWFIGMRPGLCGYFRNAVQAAGMMARSIAREPARAPNASAQWPPVMGTTGASRGRDHVGRRQGHSTP
jgi:hypothetical protein